MMSLPKPVPAADHLTAPYWQGCLEGTLRLQLCNSCGKGRFPPGPVCPHCKAAGAEWVESSGRASVYSWIVVRHPIPAEVYGEDVPYVVALVDLDGVRMPTNIVGCAPEDVYGGMEVELSFKRVSDTLNLPQFRPLSTNA